MEKPSQHPCRSSQQCQLNTEDVFTIGDRTELLIDDMNCFYSGMSREFVPVCQQHDSDKNIFDDVNPGKCMINQKRVDAVYGPWTPEVIQTDTEWKRFDTKQLLVPSAHDGLPGQHNLMVIHSWLKVRSLTEETCQACTLYGRMGVGRNDKYKSAFKCH